MLRLIDDSPITYIDWLTFVASNENVTSHIDSVLKDIQRASEEEAMEYEEFSHILIPSRDFKKSAIGGSKDKVCSNADLHTSKFKI